MYREIDVQKQIILKKVLQIKCIDHMMKEEEDQEDIMTRDTHTHTHKMEEKSCCLNFAGLTFFHHSN